MSASAANGAGEGCDGDGDGERLLETHSLRVGRARAVII